MSLDLLIEALAPVRRDLITCFERDVEIEIGHNVYEDVVCTIRSEKLEVSEERNLEEAKDLGHTISNLMNTILDTDLFYDVHHPWPPCTIASDHELHPLTVTSNKTQAFWTCHVTSKRLAVVGELQQLVKGANSNEPQSPADKMTQHAIDGGADPAVAYGNEEIEWSSDRKPAYVVMYAPNSGNSVELWWYPRCSHQFPVSEASQEHIMCECDGKHVGAPSQAKGCGAHWLKPQSNEAL